MNWSAFLSGLLGTTLPGLVVSLLMLYLTSRTNKSMERHRKELEQNIVRFSKWHDRRLESLITVYNAFCDVLDFLRRNLYVETKEVRMDPMHEFFRTIDRQIVYLDDSMAEKVKRYQSELIGFWNWSMKSLSEKGEESRKDIRHRLDTEIPSYLPRLRRDINEFLDPNYLGSQKEKLREKTLAPGRCETEHVGCVSSSKGAW